MRDPDHHYVKAFKVWDTSQEVLNNHYQDSHTRKALSEHFAEKLLYEGAKDIIHEKS